MSLHVNTCQAHFNINKSLFLYQSKLTQSFHYYHFRLREKPNREEKSQTMPVGKARALQTRSMVSGDLSLVAALSESEAGHRIQQEANMANEVGLVVLDVMGLYCTHFKVTGLSLFSSKSTFTVRSRT